MVLSSEQANQMIQKLHFQASYTIPHVKLYRLQMLLKNSQANNKNQMVIQLLNSLPNNFWMHIVTVISTCFAIHLN